MTEDEKDSKLRDRWLGRLQREDQAHKEFRKVGKEATGAFQSEREDKRDTLYPVFWANAGITHSASFNRQPKPDVRRRLNDSQGDKQLALMIERAIAYQQDTTPFDDHSNRAVREFIVAGLGCTRLYLKTDTATAPVINPLTGEPVVGEDGEPMTQEIVSGQYVCPEYIPWDKFRWEPNKDWEDVDWIGFDHFLTGAEIEEQFDKEVQGAHGTEPTGTGSDTNKLRAQKYANQYLVHEIWDRKTRTVVFVCDAVEEVLRETPDPLKLKDFYPCPRPMMMGVRTGELIPTPEYTYVKHLCDDANTLTSRIRNLVGTVRDVGYYDAAFIELQSIMSAPDGTRVPLANLLERLGGVAGLQNVLVSVDNTPKVTVIATLMQQREGVKSELYELTGISDIVRGASDANETATAQQLKGKWANVRLSEKMREVSLHFRGIFRIMAELIAEHFEPAQMLAQTGIEVTPEQIETLRSDMSRSYAIDVETDSTIAQDEQQEKTDRLEFVKTITEYLGAMAPLQNAVPADLTNALLTFVTRSFRHGRLIEEQIEQLPGTQQQLQTLNQQMQQAQQQVEQLTAQLQQQGKQLQDTNERKESREDFKAQSEHQAKQAEAAKDMAQVELARNKDFREANAPPPVARVA